MPNYFLIDNLVCLADSEEFTIPVHHQSARILQKDSGVSLLCKPTEMLTSSSFRPKIRVLKYILSEPNFSSYPEKAPQFLPIFRQNLNFSFNKDSLIFLPTLILLLSNCRFANILLPFCYSIGEKNLTRRLQNGRLGMSLAMGACGGSSVHSEDLGLPEAKPQVRRERHAK